VTRLRKLMLDELQRRNYATLRTPFVLTSLHPRHRGFREYFRRSPDRLGPQHIREYQVHLFRDCKLRQERSKVVPLLCVFSSSGHSDGRILPITFRFPSFRGGCPQY
jgi:hypothetical protein